MAFLMTIWIRQARSYIAEKQPNVTFEIRHAHDAGFFFFFPVFPTCAHLISNVTF